MLKTQRRFLFLLAASLLLAGCMNGSNAARRARQATMGEEGDLPFTPTEKPQWSETAHDGSLFQPRGAGWSPWRDATASQPGDILTVRVLVNHTAEKTATTDLSRGSSISGGISSFFGMEPNLPGVDSTDPLNNTTAQQLMSAQMESAFSGEGDTRRTDLVVADISVMVMHVFPNGNMRIFGTQDVQVNNESSLLRVEGIVRPSDISYDNIVTSERIAQARIELTGRGVLTDKQTPGIGMRVVDWIWPF